MTDQIEDRPDGPTTLEASDQHILSIEHPCLVKNVDKAIDMLGGAVKIAEALQKHSEKTLGLNFDPGNPTARTIQSFSSIADNVLFEISAPKRIGKRKRGSKEAFTPLRDTDTKKDARHLVRTLQDYGSNVNIRVLGQIRSSHVWRAMPDNVYTVTGHEALNMRSKLVSGKYEDLLNVDLNNQSEEHQPEAVPPPVFSSTSLPQGYNYRQGSHLRDAGRSLLEDV